MQEFEYMRIQKSIIPEAFISHYYLDSIAVNRYTMMEIHRGMYILPQAGILDKKQLQAHINTEGYYQIQHTHGLFCHHTRDILFTLVVESFGSQADLDHLLFTIKYQ